MFAFAGLTLTGHAQDAEQAAAPETVSKPLETVPLDEVTALKVQNISLQIEVLQGRAEKEVYAFMERNGMNKAEWWLDGQAMTLHKRVPQPADKEQ